MDQLTTSTVRICGSRGARLGKATLQTQWLDTAERQRQAARTAEATAWKQIIPDIAVFIVLILSVYIYQLFLNFNLPNLQLYACIYLLSTKEICAIGRIKPQNLLINNN